MSLRIAFVGLPLAPLLLAGDGHTIVWAGICRHRALGTRRLRQRIGEANVAIVPDLGRPELLALLRAREPDIVVSWFWTKKIPSAIRGLARHGAIGVHPSLLPRHRGPDPTFWAIDAGDAETGVTAHRIDADYDTGPILGQRPIAIDPSWNAWTLAKKLDRPSLSLLRDVVGAFARGAPPTPVFQDETKATQAPEPDEGLLELRWSEPASAIERRVRAASPWPGAFTEIGGEVVTLTHVRRTENIPRALDPGEAWVRADGIAVVRAGDVGIELHAGRAEDLDASEGERELDVTALADLVRATTH
jgi:methionyl-tRNA formyltransferase